MTLREVLRSAARSLATHRVTEPHLDARVLLCHALGITTAELYLCLDAPCATRERDRFRSLVERRARHEPIAYILGRREFYSLDFHVDPRVLVPRPETELLVDAALALARRHPTGQPLAIADVGTGSGAIAIAIAISHPHAHLYATDASAPALEVAAANRELHGLHDRVTLLHGNLLEPLPQEVDIIVANLPYVSGPDLICLEPDLAYEPRIALEGGLDGLDWVRMFLHQARGKCRGGTNLVLEIGQGQSQEVRRLADLLFPEGAVEVLRDPAGIERVVALTVPCAAPVPG